MTHAMFGSTLSLVVAFVAPPSPGVLPVRTRAPAMMSPILPAPPAPPSINLDKGYGGGDDAGLTLMDVPHDEYKALASLWAFQYEMAAAAARSNDDGFGDEERNAASSRYAVRWVGDLAPTGWFGALKGRALGVYFDVAHGDSADALCLVRYERDTSSLARAP